MFNLLCERADNKYGGRLPHHVRVLWDELATMPGDKCILQLRGLPPFFSRKYDLKNHPNYKYTAEADKKNAFELDRLIWRRRPPLKTAAFFVAGAIPGEQAGISIARGTAAGTAATKFGTICPEVARLIAVSWLD